MLMNALPWLLAIAVAAPVACFAAGGPPGGRFVDRTINIGGTNHRYGVYLPPGWSKNERWPVVLFLHGAGERGDDGKLQTTVGLGPELKKHPERYPAVVVFPQCDRGFWWNHPPMAALAMAVLDEAMKEWNGDQARVYLTGVSMGGFGSWNLAARHPGRFAAVAPVCGGITFDHTPIEKPAPFPGEGSPDPFKAAAALIGKTPVWVFHGAADQTILVSQSRRIVEALRAAGGNVKYTEYPGVGHDSWLKAYAEPELGPWLMSQRTKR